MSNIEYIDLKHIIGDKQVLLKGYVADPNNPETLHLSPKHIWEIKQTKTGVRRFKSVVKDLEVAKQGYISFVVYSRYSKTCFIIKELTNYKLKAVFYYEGANGKEFARLDFDVGASRSRDVELIDTVLKVVKAKQPSRIYEFLEDIAYTF